MTAFAAAFIPAKLVADTQSDWLGESAVKIIRGIVSTVEYYERLSDDALYDWAHSHNQAIRDLGAQRYWDEVENHRWELHLVTAILDHRAEQRDTELAKVRYSFAGPLTHSPFAGLKVA
jgi:hypothetical protein